MIESLTAAANGSKENTVDKNELASKFKVSDL